MGCKIQLQWVTFVQTYMAKVNCKTVGYYQMIIGWIPALHMQVIEATITWKQHFINAKAKTLFVVVSYVFLPFALTHKNIDQHCTSKNMFIT